jgi:hypothetical protein
MSCNKYFGQLQFCVRKTGEHTDCILAIRRSSSPNPALLVQMRLKRGMGPSRPGFLVHWNDILMSHEDLCAGEGSARVSSYISLRAELKAEKD